MSGMTGSTRTSRARRGPARTAATLLLDFSFPPACAGCHAEGTLLCPRCTGTLGARLELPSGTAIGLPAALPIPLVQLEWSAPFSGPVRAALHALKYNGERRLAVPLAAAAAERWRLAAAGGDMLVPVPIHAERARRRGYDQAALLAAALSSELSMPWLAALERTRATPPQFELGRSARQANVAGAFVVPWRATTAVCGRWVVLVDDVVTTGATLIACAVPLLAAGALAVSALTVARER